MMETERLENGRGRRIPGHSWLPWRLQSHLTFRPRDTQPQAIYWAIRRSCWRTQICQLQPPCPFAGLQGQPPSRYGAIQHSTLSGQVGWMSPA
uniref:SKI2 subunit of superkiller complex n=1 Tax=Mus musculus TaxID=10090 RepID=G3UZ05_MOUSE